MRRPPVTSSALVSTERAYAVAPWSYTVIAMHAGILGLCGQTERADALVRALGDGEAYGASLGLMQYHLFRQDVDQAALWARKGIEQRDLVIPFMLRHPAADALRASAHWPALTKMMNIVETVS